MQCSTCSEPVQWVGSRKAWVHVPTFSVECNPACSDCGKRPARHGVGSMQFDGNSTRFVVREWRCDAHAPAGMIQHIR